MQKLKKTSTQTLQYDSYSGKCHYDNLSYSFLFSFLKIWTCKWSAVSSLRGKLLCFRFFSAQYAIIAEDITESAGTRPHYWCWVCSEKKMGMQVHLQLFLAPDWFLFCEGKMCFIPLSRHTKPWTPSCSQQVAQPRSCKQSDRKRCWLLIWSAVGIRKDRRGNWENGSSSAGQI